MIASCGVLPTPEYYRYLGSPASEENRDRNSSPQVRYPDYYGIDMSRMNEFIAFKAAVALLCDRGMEYVILDAYQKAKRQQKRRMVRW